jgi:hypothetical protein
MGLSYFTLIHVLISLVGITSGFGMLSGMLAGTLYSRWNTIFLVTTTATTVTGFFFPFRGFTPAFGTGVVSMLVLLAAIYALCAKHLSGGWRKVYAITAVVALYLNVFVLVVQLFQKMPVLRELAPTQAEPAFTITQGALLIAFVALGFATTSRFRTVAPAKI